MTPGTCHCPEELEWLCRERPVQTCTDSLTPSKRSQVLEGQWGPEQAEGAVERAVCWESGHLNGPGPVVSLLWALTFVIGKVRSL